MKYSLVIPARDEAEGIAATVLALTDALDAEQIDYELIVVDDASVDDTAEVVDKIAQENPRVRSHRSHNPNGFGFAVRAGLDVFTGDAVAIVMADGSDSPSDVIAYYHALEAGHECVFGSRFVRGARVVDYPRSKLLLGADPEWFG